MSTKLTLKCPVRGILKASKKSKDGLTPTEEYYRVEAIKYLVEELDYPVDHIKIEPVVKKFGNGGRNSFRSDFAVLDVPIDSIDTNDVDTLLSHAILLCEVKRDNAKSDYVKHTQVQPMLDFSKRDDCIGLYWDNVEQRVFWQEIEGGTRGTLEGPLSFLPEYGIQIKTKPLTFADTAPSDSLLDVFERIENILHQASFDHEKRYEIILQLLLAKIFDEHAHATRPDTEVGIQDYSAIGTPSNTALNKFNKILAKAVTFYEKHLPNPIESSIPVSGDTLLDVLRILAPVRITHSKRDIVQTFYMKFAKHMYKWDLAQFFTPTEVTDFIVKLANPQFGEHVCDPACGSADFLVAAFHIGREFNPGYADCVWGVDNSANAVQVSVLNMVLNGDGKTNIQKADSLETVEDSLSRYDIMLCNPPFGKKIIEKRKSVLRHFDLGYEWSLSENGLQKSSKLLDSQESGLLFVEVCLKQARPNGRIGIILPNGYLGNRSHRYQVFREWLLTHARLAGICSFPRFTFKASGADVSASVLFLEKKSKPSSPADDDYQFFVEMIEKVGCEAGNKKAAPTYVRNPDDGSFIVDDDGDYIVDSDFEAAINRIRASGATECFDWLTEGQSPADGFEGWSIDIKEVYSDPDLTIDPKRYSRKVRHLRDGIAKHDHLVLGDIVDFIDEKKTSGGAAVRTVPSRDYFYVELSDIGFGDFNSNKLKGWELPSRARHFAESGDIYFGSIWGSAVKWCFIGQGYDSHVVTNGCHRCRIKPEFEHHLIDLLAYMNTEGWGVQMRSFARGSDGLAEISRDDAKKVIIPIIRNDSVRKELDGYVENLKRGRVTIKSAVSGLIESGDWQIDEPEKRPSHIVLV
ncbi:hypothetical protein CWE22_10020 [Pseudidiomarina aestuarii]|uniref:DNA methylase adenine-specific domain-containing protein n=1 Tax=Pseudidiomarina aestuarii TaxID=624146 RepID=A0A7Z6ZSR8_9GAMM|nr:N-6 DNA methylase [Pseudidiomarina aestuarii]RUO39618.1 hypothetical protein CWE22_10020 [Pseudidiomarina aestuarii]